MKRILLLLLISVLIIFTFSCQDINMLLFGDSVDTVSTSADGLYDSSYYSYYYYFTNNTSYDIEITPDDYQDWYSFTLDAYGTYALYSYSSYIDYSYNNAAYVTESNDTDGSIIFSYKDDTSSASIADYAYGHWDSTYSQYYYYFANYSDHDVYIEPDPDYGQSWSGFTLYSGYYQEVYLSSSDYYIYYLYDNTTNVYTYTDNDGNVYIYNNY